MTCLTLRYLQFHSSHLHHHAMIKDCNEAYLPKVVRAAPTSSACYNDDDLINLIIKDEMYMAKQKDRDTMKQRFGEEVFKKYCEEEGSDGRFECLVYLFENVFPPDFYLESMESTPYHQFAKIGDIEGLNYCLKLGTNINLQSPITCHDNPGGTALHVAAYYNQFEVCRFLIEKGIMVKGHPTVRDLNRNTAAHIAASKGHTQIVTLLDRGGADLLA